MIKSISTQTGNYSYSLDLQFTGNDPFEVGFSGESSKIFSFSGQSGKIYDQGSNFCYSYGLEESVQISGNRIGDYNNYFINSVLFNSKNNQNLGNLENFFSNGPVLPELTFNGYQPNYRVASGKFVNGSTTGFLYVYSDGVENFKFYSGNFLGGSGEFFSFQYPFDSGNITSSKLFDIGSFISDGGTGKFNVAAEFYTDFGLVQKNFDLYSIYELETLFSIDGSEVTTTGLYNYTFYHEIAYGDSYDTTPFDLEFTFRNNSGNGDFAFFTGGGTGYYTGTTNVNIVASKVITESGTLTGTTSVAISGVNPYLGFPYTGTTDVNYTSPFVFATGDFNYDYSILATGYSSGFLTNNVNVPSGDFPVQPIGFTGELEVGFHNVTGTGVLNLTGISYYEFQSWIVDTFEYTGNFTGRVYSSGTTGLISGTGITGGTTWYNSTGLTGIDYSYPYIDYSNNLTGYFNENIDCTGNQGRGFIYDARDLSGVFYHRFYSDIFSEIDFDYYFEKSIQQTGYVKFTGDYLGSGTGAILSYIEKEGYSGVGIGGFNSGYSKTVETGDGQLGIFYDNNNRNLVYPISGLDDFSNILEISGNSGIALIPNHTDRIAEIYEFSINDASRASYKQHPSWVNYKWMDGSTTFSNEVNFRFSPYYYASGTGIYLDDDTLTAAITYYSGNYPNLDYQGIDTFTFTPTNGWQNIENLETLITFDNNEVDWKLLITISNNENVKPSGFFFLVWEDESDITQDNSPKVFNSYYGMDDSSSFPSYSYYLSEDRKYPTGRLTEGFIYNDGNNYTKGANTTGIQYNITGSGYVENYPLNFNETTYQIESSLSGYFQKTGYYSSVTGTSIFSLNTGVFSNDTIFLLSFDNLSIEDNLEQGSFFNETDHGSYTIGATYPTVESISGDITGILKPVGYETFLSGQKLIVSGDVNQHIQFIFGLNSSSNSDELMELSFNNQIVSTLGAEFVTSGTGNIALSDLNSFVTGTGSVTGFVSGQWIAREDISGYWDITRSGEYGLVSTTFTGEIQSTGLVTGRESFTIYDGSGSFLLTGQKTGSGVSINNPILDSGVSITPFTGNLYNLFTGTGLYSETFSVNLDGSGFSMNLPIYQKSFSGEYNFYTGVDTGNLVAIDFDSSTEVFSGIKTITGLGQFQMAIEKVVDILTDDLEIFYSGQNGVTGGLSL